MPSEAVARKLTTILAADVVGYSQLMALDEEATLGMLKSYRQLIDRLIDKHSGRIFKTAGDAVLAEFGSAVEAVRCAISIQEDLRVRNAEQPEDRQMWLRVGINVGDVMVEGDDLFGDGVNVAARLEGLADKGGICISGSAFDQVKNKLSIAFRDLGAQKVKNIPEPIPAYEIVPGRVAVARASGPVPPEDNHVPKTRSRWLLSGFAALCFLVGLIGVMYFAGLLPPGLAPEHSHDGDWLVTVDSLSGCKDNKPRRFPVRVVGGHISEPEHLRPKQGSVAEDGAFGIRVTDRVGNHRASLTGRIAGDFGQGHFKGVKPGCAGAVSIVRQD